MSPPLDPIDLQTLLDSIQEFIVVKDGAGRWLFCNETALAAYEMSGYDYLGITDAELILLKPAFAEGFRRNIDTDEQAWRNRRPTVIEKSLVAADGRIGTWEVIKTPAYTAEGARHRLVIVSRNITERKRAEKALQESEERFKNLALQDGLTGIPNRRGILDLISLQLSAGVGAQPESSFALIYMDLDRFKLINDQQGHEVGDELLIAFTKRTRGCLREGDLFGRIGGDEFVIFLCDSDAAVTLKVAERLCRELSQPWSIKGREITTSSSLGVAFYPQAGRDVHTLLRHADEALYRAKRAGRSRVMVYEAGMKCDGEGVS